MQYPIIDLIASAYINNGWTGLDIPQIITYEPIQLGSGEPSTDNIRPILPATTLNIGGNDVPVYGGNLDINTRVLTIDRKLDIFYGTENWLFVTYGGESHYRIYKTVTDIEKTTPNTTISATLKSNLYKTIAYQRGSLDIGISSRYDMGQINIFQEEYQTFDAWKAFISNTPLQVCYELENPIAYQLTESELINAIGIKDDISHHLKLPLPHYFPHPVIDALQRAAAGTQTADDTEILRHYLTPLGIGGI